MEGPEVDDGTSADPKLDFSAKSNGCISWISVTRLGNYCGGVPAIGVPDAGVFLIIFVHG